MKSAVNYVAGTVRVRLDCKYPERVINLCAGNNVDFWDLERAPDGAARMTVTIGGYAELRRVSRETGAFSIRVTRRRGVPFLLWRIRKRYALLVGMVLCLLAVTVSSFFVWQIDVTGNETVPTSEILAALRSLGVDIGTSTLAISQERISNRMLLLVPRLSWITLNTHGSRIEVMVREKILKPELYDPDVPTGVYAAKAGIIVRTVVTEGWKVAAQGDTVLPGDELVSAHVPVGAGSLVHAQAEIWARTWYEFSLQMPLENAKKTYTGATSTHTAIILGGKRINFYFSGGNPYAGCDKITMYTPVELPGGAVLPLTIVRDTFEEYTLTEGTLTVQEAERILSAQLLYRLEQTIGEGSVTSAAFETAEENGVVTVTLRAECLEQIGAERALTEAEIAGYKAPSVEDIPTD